MALDKWFLSIDFQGFWLFGVWGLGFRGRDSGFNDSGFRLLVSEWSGFSQGGQGHLDDVPSGRHVHSVSHLPDLGFGVWGFGFRV